MNRPLTDVHTCTQERMDRLKAKENTTNAIKVAATKDDAVVPSTTDSPLVPATPLTGWGSNSVPSTPQQQSVTFRDPAKQSIEEERGTTSEEKAKASRVSAEKRDDAVWINQSLDKHLPSAHPRNQDLATYEKSVADSSPNRSGHGDSAGLSWLKDPNGLFVKRESRRKREALIKAQESNAQYSISSKPGELTELSFERSTSADSYTSKIRMGLRIPRISSKYENMKGGILRVRPGDSEIDRQLGLSSQLSVPEIDGAKQWVTETASRPSGPMRWAQRLHLGAIVLQSSLRCHQARLQFRRLLSLLASDEQMKLRQQQSLSALSALSAVNKFKNRLLDFRAAKNDDQSDAQHVEMLSGIIFKLRADKLCSSMHEFLGTLDQHDLIFARVCDKVAVKVRSLFESFRARANAHAELRLMSLDDEMIWRPIDQSESPFAETSGQYVKIHNESRILKAVEEEDAQRLARALGLFLRKLRKSAHMPEDKHKMPSLEMAVAWLRINSYNVAQALRYYEKLLAYSKAWNSDSDACVNPWHPTPDHMMELDRRGLQLLRSDLSGKGLADQYGAAVAIVDARTVFVKEKHSLANAQALFTLFWREITDDFKDAVFKGITVVVDMTRMSQQTGAFTFSAVRDLQIFFGDIFPPHVLKRVFFYGSSGSYGAGFLTAAKLVFPRMCSEISYIQSESGETFSLARVKEELKIQDAAHLLMGRGKMKCAFILDKPHFRSAMTKFSQLLSSRSREIELERNNVEQQALLYRDGWYGHYDFATDETNLNPHFEGGSATLKVMRRRKDELVTSSERPVSCEEVKGMVGGVKMGMPRSRVVHAQSIARACKGSLASQCRAEILKSGGIMALVAMISGGGADEKSAAALALSQACIGNKESAQEAHEQDAIPPLIGAAKCGPDLVRVSACAAIAQICCNHPPSCHRVYELQGIRTLVACVRNGVGATQRESLLALAMVCQGSENGRQQCAQSDGLSLVFECLRSPNISVQSAAAKAMASLISEQGDPYNVVKRVCEMDGLTLMAKLLTSNNLEAERNASSALARSMEADSSSLEYFLRGGSVKAMLSLCERYRYVNVLMGSMTPDADGKCKMEDIKEKYTEEFADKIPLHYFLEICEYLSPESEDEVLIADWFDCQRAITHALKLALNDNDAFVGRLRAEQAGLQVIRFETGVKLIYTLGTTTLATRPCNYPIDESRIWCNSNATAQVKRTKRREGGGGVRVARERPLMSGYASTVGSAHIC